MSFSISPLNCLHNPGDLPAVSFSLFYSLLLKSGVNPSYFAFLKCQDVCPITSHKVKEPTLIST